MVSQGSVGIPNVVLMMAMVTKMMMISMVIAIDAESDNVTNTDVYDSLDVEASDLNHLTPDGRPFDLHRHAYTHTHAHTRRDEPSIVQHDFGPRTSDILHSFSYT
jgi:hypothetical protein